MSVPAIEVRGLTKDFSPPLLWLRKKLKKKSGRVVRALDDVSLSVPAGQVFGLVGRNGQGKTTLIKSTCGLLEPTLGEIRVFGHHTVRELDTIKSLVGLVSADDRTFYPRLTCLQNVLFFAELHGLTGARARARISELSEQLELTDFLDRKFQECSSGNKQRLSILRALLPNPPLLLLDEPTRSLDPISAEGLRRIIGRWAESSPRHTVLITTHNLLEVEQLCKQVAIISRGRIIEHDNVGALRSKYAGNEKVRVSLVRAPSPEWLARATEEVAGLSYGLTAVGQSVLTLSRRSDDREVLTQLLQRVVTAELGVAACETEHFGLQGILEQIEARELQREGKAA